MSSSEADLFRLLRAAILNGEYAPHQRLIEADLCSRYDTTRFVLRAVLKQLAAAGLVESQTNRGTRVRLVSLEEAVEITEVRRELEGLTAALAARRCTEEDEGRLQETLVQMEEAIGQSDFLHYSNLNIELHGHIRRIAAHATSARILEGLHAQVVRYRYTARPAVSLLQHRQIVAAIIAGNPDAARNAMYAHVDSVVEALRSRPRDLGGLDAVTPR